MKLTIAQRSGIRRWLKLDKPAQWYKCPFGIFKREECECVCPVVFPGLAKKRMEETHTYLSCPCACYPRSYVVRVARVALARHGIVGERKKREYKTSKRSAKRITAQD